MYGVGKKTVVKLQKIGIYKIGDFAIREDQELQKVLGKMYFVLKDWINGHGDDIVSDAYDDPKLKSFSYKKVQEVGVLIQESYIPRLKYLDAVDKMYFTEVNSNE